MLDGEKKLIKRAIKGEAQAFGLLYDHYQPQIYRFIYLKVSHREEAEDLTHQVFFNSWSRMADYKHRGFPFSSWLYQIARNEVIDYYRTKKSHLDIEDVISEDISLPDFDDSIQITIDVKIDTEKVKEAIKLLKPIEQDVIILRFVEDLSPSEVATVVDKTSQAVRIIQHRAIKSLKQILESTKNGK